MQGFTGFWLDLCQRLKGSKLKSQLERAEAALEAALEAVLEAALGTTALKLNQMTTTKERAARAIRQ